MTSTPPTINVLLVEDNPEDADLVQESLGAATEAQFEIHTACRLKEAHQQLATRQFDIVLLDLSLPDSSGLRTLETVLAWDTGLPIVVLTGLGEVTTVLHTLLHTLHYSTDQPKVVRAGDRGSPWRGHHPLCPSAAGGPADTGRGYGGGSAPEPDTIYSTRRWTWGDSNPRPTECHSVALPTAPQARL